MPTVGDAIPSAFAAAIPYIVFLTMASARLDEDVPVDDAIKHGLPLAGVRTLPIVVTPRGNG